MTFIAKPGIAHPSLPKNTLGLTTRDYEGAISTLCAGCGHDSVTAALIQAVFELDIEPHMLAKMSGIGCPRRRPISPARPTVLTPCTGACRRSLRAPTPRIAS